ncbi:LuxR C-terminal-related transcriptional regulator [Micromonospora sp. NPDC049081]|uniref:helix-turn-helix transcriptional regulator n=1 Tax=Micromonospora sp. NPDC049081 TaxID=3155150 RepID=UPI0033F3F2BB
MPQQHDSAEVPAGPPLLASRLTPPAPPEPMLWRPRLSARLDAGAAGTLTLVRAAAGWGKTTILTAWARAADEDPPAWVQVEAGDSGERLWAYLTAALRGTAEPPPHAPPDALPGAPPAGRPGASAAQPSAAQPSAAQPSVVPVRSEQLEALAATLAARERPVRLVVDDLHRVTDPAVLTGLEFLLRHADGRLRLIAAARTDLPPALHRLRLAGDLTEIGPDELAFTTDEVADLLVAHGVPLPAAAVVRLRDRTGGWPAGLRFAALAARGQADPQRWAARFGGDHPDVAAYLRAEVLGQLPPPAREVLRRCAVGPAVRADLADALTGRTDAGQLLAGLARDGGFLHRDDSDPPWYRPHPLLADLLREELADLADGERAELHGRAADWHTDHDRPAEALRHALTAGQWDRATGLLLTHWPELLPYDRGTPDVAPPAPPPAEAVHRDPELALAAGTERAYAGDREAATARLRDAVAAARSLPAPRRDRFHRLALALELTLARLAGDHPGVRRAAARLLATVTGPALPPPPPPCRSDVTPTHRPSAVGDHPEAVAPTGDDPRTGEDVDVLAVAGTALGLVELAEGELRSAGAWFTRALAAARQAGRPRTELVDATRTALLLALAGELAPAEETAHAALVMPPCQGWSSRVDCGYAHLALALVALHRDQPTEATAELAAAGAAMPVEASGAGGTTSGTPTADAAFGSLPAPVGFGAASARVGAGAAAAPGGAGVAFGAAAAPGGAGVGVGAASAPGRAGVAFGAASAPIMVGVASGGGTVGAVVALCRATLLRDAGEPAAAIEVVRRARDELTGAWTLPGAALTGGGVWGGGLTGGGESAGDGGLAGVGVRDVGPAGAGGLAGDGVWGGGLVGGGGLADRLLALEADLRGEQGDLDTARRLLAERFREPDPDPVLGLALARVELRAGDVRAAGHALPDWDAPDAAGWPLSVRLATGVLDAVLARRSGDERRAGRLLERVLDLSGRHGYRRVFTRAEPEVRDLLAAHLDSGTAHRPAVSDLVRDAEQPTEHGSGDPQWGPGGPERALTEPLTERELTILRYLQSILSNVEIAGELSLSVNTVKTHVRNIYRKLDATRRREAVRRARSLRLL